MKINLSLRCGDENKWEIELWEETLVSVKSQSLERDPTGKGKSSLERKFLFQSKIRKIRIYVVFKVNVVFKKDDICKF